MQVVAITLPKISRDIFNPETASLMVDTSQSPAYVLARLLGSFRFFFITVACDPWELEVIPDGATINKCPAAEDKIFLTFDLEGLRTLLKNAPSKLPTPLRVIYTSYRGIQEQVCPELLKHNL